MIPPPSIESLHRFASRRADLPAIDARTTNSTRAQERTRCMAHQSRCSSACAYHTVRAHDQRGNLKLNYLQCLRVGREVVSDEIRSQGRWPHCDELPQLFQRAARGLPREQRPRALFVDAGANVGSCSLLMLHLGIRTVSFEPLPSNLYYFTASVLANAGFASRLALYGMALGDPSAGPRGAPRRLPLYSGTRNLGNTVLGAAVGDNDAESSAMRARWRDTARRERHLTPITTLDAVTWPDPSFPPPPIALLKLDVRKWSRHQARTPRVCPALTMTAGYLRSPVPLVCRSRIPLAARTCAEGWEAKLLLGATRLLGARAISLIKFEIAPRWLHAQNDTAAGIHRLLASYGCVVLEPQDPDTSGVVQSLPVGPARLEALDREGSGSFDFLADCRSRSRATRKVRLEPLQ